MRLIDADALIADCQLAQKQADRHGREFASAFYSGGGDISTEWWCVEDMIENAPTVDAIEVVRCKDCKRWNPAFDREVSEYGVCQIYSQRIATKRDFFCSKSERRTNETDRR